MTAPFVDPSSLLPQLDPGAVLGADPTDEYRAPAAGRVTAWNATTRANTITVRGTVYTDLPVCSGAEAVMAVGVTVLVIAYADTWAVIDRLRIP